MDFTTAQYCTSQSMNTIITALKNIIHKYTSRSLNITHYHGDPEFDKSELRSFLEPALLHIYAKNEHIGNIEHSTCRIKERARSTYNGTSYKRITMLMVRSLIEAIVESLNAFPSPTGISKTMSPSTIVEGKPKPNFGAKMITYGSYALVHSGTSNDMKSRAIPAIALRKSNNDGGHYFMNKHTGRHIHGYHWTELPIDEYVISRVEKLAEDEKQPIMHNGVPCFEW